MENVERKKFEEITESPLPEQEKNPNEDFLREHFSEQEMTVWQQEKEISLLRIDKNGKIAMEDHIVHDNNSLRTWRTTEGVIDVQEILGATVVIFDSSEQIPHGAPDFSHSKIHEASGFVGGQYHVENNTCFIDLAHGSPNKKLPPNHDATIMLRHELRHHIFSQAKLPEENIKLHDTLDKKFIKEDERQQKAYLNELHGYFMGACEDADDFNTSFRTFDRWFYSAIKGKETTTPHREVASFTEYGQQAAETLFYYLQGFILVNRAREEIEVAPAAHQKIIDFSHAIGALLATSSTIEDTLPKTKLFWEQLMGDAEIKQTLTAFGKDYSPDTYPNYQKNLPVITDELNKTLETQLPINQTYEEIPWLQQRPHKPPPPTTADDSEK